MKNIGYCFLICLTFVSCKEEKFEFENLSNNEVFIIGHGGSGFISPTNNIADNSLKSIELAIEGFNADGVEVDLQLSKDSQLVLYHDKDLYTKTSCVKGGINEYDWDELKNCRYKKKHFGSISVDEGLALLEEVVLKFSKRIVKPQLHLDIRQSNFDDKRFTKVEFYELFASKVVDLIEKYQAEDWIFCGSQDVKFLKVIDAKNQNIKLFLEGSNVAELVKKKTELNYFGIVVANDRISKSEVQLAHDNNIRVAIFSIKALAANLEAVDKSPDYLITDNITLMQDILR